jgi:hypothetical protein
MPDSFFQFIPSVPYQYLTPVFAGFRDVFIQKVYGFGRTILAHHVVVLTNMGILAYLA